MIHEQKNYVNSAGQSLVGFWPVGVENFESEAFDGLKNPKFQAQSALQFTLNGQPGQFQFGFEIDGKTVAEAFENYPSAFALAEAKAKVELQNQIEQQEAARQKIIIPPPTRHQRRVG